MLKLENRRWGLWGILAVLLVVSAGINLRIRTVPLDNDEIWEIWQSFGTPQQIIQWTSSTEYPTYMLMLGGWKELAGIHPHVLRYFSLLLALPGVAFMYRAVRRTNGEWAGILAALAYGVFPITQFISLYTRSYVIAYSVLPAALWLASRYFERPTILRGLLLGVLLYLLYVSTITIVPALGLFALYILALYPRQSWKGIYPGIVGALLALPDFVTNKLRHVGEQSTSVRLYRPAPLPQAWFDFFNYFTRTPIWYVLVMAAAGLVIYCLWRTAPRGRRRIRYLYWVIWMLAVPLFIDFFDPQLGFFNVLRYAWWYAFGVAILLGVGLALLPRAGRWLAVGVLVVVAFLPMKLSTFGYFATPLGENLSWLRDHMHADDALMIDPAISCNYLEEWDYYTRVFFPQGLRYVTEPEGTKRVWYVASQNEASQALEAEMSKTRAQERYVGPAGCFFRLYEAPPDETGVLYENGLRFHGFQIMDGDKPLNYPLVFREQQPLRVRLWWSVDEPVALDYSINLSLTGNGAFAFDSSDSAPQLIYPENAPVETSRWTPGQIYLEERMLTMPALNYRGHVNLALATYWYGEPGTRFNAPGVRDDGWLFLASLTAVAW